MRVEGIMHEVIVCEKPTSAEKIAKALSPSAKKKVYNKKVKYWELEKDSKDITVVSAVGHLYSLTPDTGSGQSVSIRSMTQKTASGRIWRSAKCFPGNLFYHQEVSHYAKVAL